MNDEKDVFAGLREHWYIACAASRLAARPLAARVLDHDVALFRGDDGRPHALADRCCHRGVKLSLGRREGGGLACRYHGWRFAGDGRCVHIPSLATGQRIASGCAVAAFSCVEQDGQVWVWTGRSPPSAPPPEIAGFAARRWAQGTIDHACDWVSALENNVDWCHPAFAHPWTHGQFYLKLLHGLQDQAIALAATPDGLTVTGPLDAAGAPAGGWTVTLRFRLPGRVDIDGPGRRRIVVYVVPTGPTRCRLEWLIASAWPLGPRVRWTAREPVIFRQDRVLLESATPGRERSVEGDAPPLLLRRIVALAARGEWDAAHATAHGRRLLRLRA